MLRLIGQGRGRQAVYDWAAEELGTQITFEDFVPPWSMPGLLQDLDAVFCLSKDDPIPGWSMLAAEAEACGCQVIRDLTELETR